jgi:hypothetical protein
LVLLIVKTNGIISNQNSEYMYIVFDSKCCGTPWNLLCCNECQKAEISFLKLIHEHSITRQKQ